MKIGGRRFMEQDVPEQHEGLRDGNVSYPAQVFYRKSEVYFCKDLDSQTRQLYWIHEAFHVFCDSHHIKMEEATVKTLSECFYALIRDNQPAIFAMLDQLPKETLLDRVKDLQNGMQFSCPSP